eukprot:scaffold17822_cov99-Skeletonema_dohrnii-CCMP3373.AAC.1
MSLRTDVVVGSSIHSHARRYTLSTITSTERKMPDAGATTLPTFLKIGATGNTCHVFRLH